MRSLTGAAVPVTVPAMIDVLRAIQEDIDRVVKDCRYNGVDVGRIQGWITDEAIFAICANPKIVTGGEMPSPSFCGSIDGVKFTVVTARPNEIGWLLKVA